VWTGLLGIAAASAPAPPAIALAIEEAKVDILEARPTEAMAHLDEARSHDWFALQLYLRACDHAGRMPLCDLEYADADGWEGFVWRWHHAARDPRLVEAEGCDPVLCAVGAGWMLYRTGLLDAGDFGQPVDHVQSWRLHLRVARKREDDRALADLGTRAMKRMPDHPEVLSELFIGRFDGRRTRRAQRRAVRHVKRMQPLPGPLGDAKQYRRLRFAMSAGEDELAATIADDLVARGFPRPATHKPYSEAMQDTLATLLARTREPSARGPTAPDRLAVASVLTRRLAELSRLDDAERVWRETRATDDSSSAAAEHAELLVRLGREDEAIEAAERAIALASGPVWDDALRLDAARWRAELGEAIAAWARAARDPDAAAMAQRLVPSERMDTLVSDIGATASDAPLPEPAEPLATALLQDDAAAWSTVGAWMAPRHPELAEVATWHARATDAPDPQARTVREAFLASFGQPEPGRRDAIAVASPLPDDVWEGLGLRPGEPLVIAAWASWCGPCRKELPALDALVSELRQNGSAIDGVALSVDEREAVYVQSVRRFDFESLMPLRSPSLGARLAPQALPTLWLVDPGGVVRDIRVGYSEGALAAVRQLVGE
jgi:thiol-disulfide isomerase/thioredoxin/tetratricopeptide (TPR) repeat protein